MGLLSDPDSREKIIGTVKKLKNIASALGYIGAIVWMIAVAGKKYNAGVYFSENALLPGLVSTEFSDESRATKHFTQLGTDCNSSSSSSDRLTAIQNIMLNNGLEVYQQSFSLTQKGINGTNIYGIIWAARTSSVESLVINIPIGKGCSNTGALSVVLALAKHFRRQSYLAKDVIILVTEHDVYGMKAWLDAYHGILMQDGITASQIPKHCGSIQAALVIEFDDNRISHFDVAIEGQNGLLPNLDLINLVFLILRSERIPGKLDTQDMFYGYVDSVQDHTYSAKVMMRMILKLASGHASGNHGVFYKYRIEAVTLHGRLDSNSHSYHFQEIARVIEGILRSCNNLLERFHQSFFLYLLPATNRYVSVGIYMPALGLFLLGTLFQVVTLWSTIFKDSENNKVDRFNFTSLALGIVSSHVYGITMFFCLRHLMLNSYWLITDSSEITILSGFAIVSLTMPFILRITSFGCLDNDKQWMILKCGTLVYFVAILVSVAMLNISLFLILATFYLPAFYIIERTSSRFKSGLHFITMVTTSPVCVFAMVLIADELLNGSLSTIDVDFLNILIRRMVTYLKTGYLDDALGVWTIRLYFFCILPAWTMLCSIAV